MYECIERKGIFGIMYVQCTDTYVRMYMIICIYSRYTHIQVLWNIYKCSHYDVIGT